MATMTATLLLILLVAPAAVFAVNHTVGGNSGWNQNVDYDTWAAAQTFTVGDYLVFTYGSTHSVDEVSQSSYDNCATSNPIDSHTGGSNTISLPTVGTRYFVCPAGNHCSQGMKVAVTVVASTGSTPSTPSPPSSSGSPSPPPPPPATESSPSAAAGKFCSMSNLMAGVVLGFGTMFALVV